ncbi:unnamed protein product [Peniophora sp. CBMAI 1063]|nr:unnamed protein product [Peniophora sp. CBMAI 1063]
MRLVARLHMALYVASDLWSVSALSQRAQTYGDSRATAVVFTASSHTGLPETTITRPIPPFPAFIALRMAELSRAR